MAELIRLSGDLVQTLDWDGHPAEIIVRLANIMELCLHIGEIHGVPHADLVKALRIQRDAYGTYQGGYVDA